MTPYANHFQHALGLDVWSAGTTIYDTPTMSFNPTASTVALTGPSDNVVWAPGQVNLQPGSSQLSSVRFTAPQSGQYEVRGAYSSGDQYYGATTDVHILKNGISIYDGTIAGKTAVSSFDESLQLGMGDYLDFEVGRGALGLGWDSTGLQVQVIPIPEPCALNLFVLGMLLLKGFRARRCGATT